jgi:hypothetical protein
LGEVIEVVNALAYHGTTTITAVKDFIVEALGLFQSKNTNSLAMMFICIFTLTKFDLPPGRYNNFYYCTTKFYNT